MTYLPFETIPIDDSHEPLVDLSSLLFALEPAYFNQGIKSDPALRVRLGVAERMLKAQELLGGNYQIKVWDAHRPREVQAALYDALRVELASKHPEFDDQTLDNQTQLFVTKASDPQRIPPHATGGAVDLTLVDTDGLELEMGTAFDHFGPEAAPHFFDGGQDSLARIARNRHTLIDAMTKVGFVVHDAEWWHFDYGNQVWAYKTGQVPVHGEAFISSQERI